MKILLEVTPEQAGAVSAALDLYTRMGLGQVREVANLVRHDAIPFAKTVARDDRLDRMDDIDHAMAGVARALGFAPNASYGIGSDAVPMAARRAYEVQKALDRVLAEARDPNPSFRGVNYDGLTVRYTTDPAPVATLSVEPG